MRHAGPDALARLAPLLAELRRLPALRERSPGTFYRGSQAFLHFHEDPSGDFADLKVRGAWERSRVATQRERAALLRRARGVLADASGSA
jgi:hypothetical protein